MRTIEEIKADIERCKMCDWPKCTPSEKKSRCHYCQAINFEKHDGLRSELLFSLADGIPLDRLEMLCQAEREQRAVVLPCKVGDTVYEITSIFDGQKVHREIKERAITGLGGNQLNPIWMVSKEPYEIRFHPSQFGKTVFLTPEAARAALEGGAK